MQTLIKNNNRCSSPTWECVRICSKDEDVDLSSIHNCFFIENCVLSSQSGTVTAGDETSLPAGFAHCTFRNCILCPSVAVYNNALIENTIILSNSIIIGCNRISCSKKTTYGNGTVCNMGNEMGGLEVSLFADLMYNDLNGIVHTGKIDQSTLSAYLDCVRGDYSIIDSSFVENCSLLTSVYIGSHSHIVSSTIRECTILSSEKNPTLVDQGNLSKCIVQWGCSIESGSNAEQSLFCEHTTSSCNAKIVNSIIAPNTGVSSGECNSSLVGPFIGFHHNSVLISAMWYEGKGNIGYGANIGSNHTGRLPDQECIPGEGVFFGLGCNIKYPCNLHNAPYSIIASGVTLLPQRMDFPFSLINRPSKPHAGISPALNEVFPGWVLYGNYYMIVRNEDKFAHRNKSKRNLFEMSIIRPEIVAMIFKARSLLAFGPHSKSWVDLNTLKEVDVPSDSTVEVLDETWEECEDLGECIYLEQNIDGVGKNILTEDSRMKGINVYTFFIRLFLLREFTKLLEKMKTKKKEELFEMDEWQGLTKLIKQEFGELMCSQAIAKYGDMEMELLHSAERSKEKDFTRGRHVNKSYDVTHCREREMAVIETRRKVINECIESITNQVNQLIITCGDFDISQ